MRISPVDPASDRAFVRKNTRYSAFVFGGCASDERRVVNDAIFRGVALGLERSEEGLKMRKHNGTLALQFRLHTCTRVADGHRYAR